MAEILEVTAPQSPVFKITMRVDGEAVTEESHYGPRTNRPKLAEFDIEVSDAKAWHVYQQALASALAPDVVVTFPEGTTRVDADRLRSEWTQTYGAKR